MTAYQTPWVTASRSPDCFIKLPRSVLSYEKDFNEAVYLILTGLAPVTRFGDLILLQLLKARGNLRHQPGFGEMSTAGPASWKANLLRTGKRFSSASHPSRKTRLRLLESYFDRSHFPAALM